MTIEKVDEFLKNYREYSARCDFLENEIAELERIAQELRRTFIEDNISVSQVMNGMPHGTGISDPTGRLALLSASGYLPDYIKEIDDEVEKKKSELRYKTPTVIFVESWLKVLTPRERFVVENKTLNGMFWRELVIAFKNEFGEEYSKNGLKNIRDSAIQKIYNIAK